LKKHFSEGHKEIVAHAVGGIIDILAGTIEDRDNVYPPEELHDRLFNEDYFVIGYYRAEQFLIRCGGVFKAIGEVKEYDEDRFGQLLTDLSSSEAVANKLAYIEGEQMLFDCPTFSNALSTYTDRILSVDDLEEIIKELNNL
jgi:hypothetical protein